MADDDSEDEPTAPRKPVTRLATNRDRRDRSAPVRGVPIVVIERDDETTPPPFDISESPVAIASWNHTARAINRMEKRQEQRLQAANDRIMAENAGSVGLGQRVARLEGMAGDLESIGELERKIVDLRGVDGDDGKVGEVRKDLHGLTKRLWWLAGGAGAALLTAIGIIWNASADFTRLQDKVEQLGDRIHRLERLHERPEFPEAKTWPDSPAAKETRP